VASSPSTAFTWYVFVSTSLLCSSQESSQVLHSPHLTHHFYR
jgi:hypothetical protein